MKKLICTSLLLLLFVSASVSVAFAQGNSENERCPYCSHYCPVLKRWSECNYPEKVIGIPKNTQFQTIGEIPLCAAQHKKDKYYNTIMIQNDTDHKVTVRVYYFAFDHTKRELQPGDSYCFKYDKSPCAMVWCKYVTVDHSKKVKINHNQKIALSAI